MAQKMPMSKHQALVLALLPALGGLGGGALPAVAQTGDQDIAFEAARSGEILPLGEIIARVSQRVDGRYVGAQYDPQYRIYRLKFLRGNTVIMVDVDAVTGRVLEIRGE